MVILTVMGYALLTTKQYKLNKSHKRKIATCGLTLAPAMDSGYNTCPMSGACRLPCIKVTGMNAFPTHHKARVRRTRMYFERRTEFFALFHKEMKRFIKRCRVLRYEPVCRPNITTDLTQMARQMAQAYPEIMFYDYSKIPNSGSRELDNYKITYSYSERTTPKDIEQAIGYRQNIAVVFSTQRGQRLPKSVQLHGRTFEVLDGDINDLRYLDPRDKTRVIGLRWKRSKDSKRKLAAAIRAGFVIDADAAALVQRAAA